jgi:hypothetical protein
MVIILIPVIRDSQYNNSDSRNKQPGSNDLFSCQREREVGFTILKVLILPMMNIVTIMEGLGPKVFSRGARW